MRDKLLILSFGLRLEHFERNDHLRPSYRALFEYLPVHSMRPQAVALRGIGRVAQRDALRKGTFGWLPGVTKVELLLRNLVAAVGLEPTTYGL